MKIQRSYVLKFTFSNGKILTIQPPFTIDFHISRGIMASLNSMSLRIYNLKKTTRDQIFQDWFNFNINNHVELQAGYGKNLATIFKGTLRQAWSTREGANIVTIIDAWDGGYDFANSNSSITVNEGKSLKDIIKDLMGSFQNLKVGKIGDIQGDTARPIVLDGNTFDLIKTYSGDTAFIDLETIHVLKNNECITGLVPLISSDTGLLGVPRHADASLDVNMLFEPRILVGQLIEIKSQVETQFNGQYKVVGIEHQATISESVSGTATTKLNLLIGTKITGGLKTVQ